VTPGRVIGRAVAAERARLEAGAGLRPAPGDHFRQPVQRPFTESERARTTILIGGLTRLHDTLLEAAFRGSGYQCERLPVADLACFHLGREFCNNGLCSPAYFTIGNLLSRLRELEASGLTRAEIADRYIFFTADGSGPCRFGMYSSQYRLALENAGFDGFRVLTFQQSIRSNVNRSGGLVFTADFAVAIVKAFHLGDVLNEVVHQFRPFELVAGETDQALAECEAAIVEHLRTFRSGDWRDAAPAWLTALIGRGTVPGSIAQGVWKYRSLIAAPAYLALLKACGERFDRVELDRTRVKPIVKITGEFWAQTTEGDGNYRMFQFLEQEGAEVLAEGLGAWVTYHLYTVRARFADRQRQAIEDGARWGPSGLLRRLGFRARLAAFDVGEWLYNHEVNRVARRLGVSGPHLVPQRELAALALPFYHPLARGGEGHSEVAKNIHYTSGRHCHMVLSLKPFGCLPSSQSDGVQAGLVDRFPGMLFLAVETSGEGEAHAHSRVQMALADARAAAREEFDRALAETGLDLEDVREFVRANPAVRRGLYKVPARPGVAGRAATFVYHVRGLMDRDPVRRDRSARRRRSEMTDYPAALPRPSA
jgi:predicted nucleotide-binding protein (sugar kinase/HSP70/actin superfamily)